MSSLGPRINGKKVGDGNLEFDRKALILPGVLLSASVVLFFSPERSLPVLLALAAFAASPAAVVACEPQMRWAVSWWKEQAARQTGELWANAFIAFHRDKDLFEGVLSVLCEGWGRQFADPRVIEGAKVAMLDIAADKALREKLLPAFGELAVAASTEPRMQKAVLNVARGVAAEALMDERLLPDLAAALAEGVRAAAASGRLAGTLRAAKQAAMDLVASKALLTELLSGLAPGIVATLEHPQLRAALVGVLKEGVSDALDDDRFIERVRDCFCDCLQAPHIYRAAVSGMAISLNPFVRRGTWGKQS